MVSFWLNASYEHGIYIIMWCALVMVLFDGLTSSWLYIWIHEQTNVYINGKRGNWAFLMILIWSNELMIKYAFMSYRYYAYKVFV